MIMNKSKKCIGLIMSIIFLCIFMCGCSPDNAQGSAQSGYEVTDCQGTVVKIPKKPQHIVTLSMYTDAIALGMVTTDKMAAIQALSDDPMNSNIVDKAKKIPKKLKSPSTEEIFALHPDLVIASEWTSADIVGGLRELGLPVIVCKSVVQVADIKDCIHLIAQALQEEKKGELVIQKMDAELADITKKVNCIPQEQRKNVVLLSLMESYGGIGCSFDTMCKYAGVVNGMAVAGIHSGQTMSKEMLVNINPDILLLSSYNDHGTYDVTKFNREYLDDPSLQTINAIQKNGLRYPREGYIYNASQDFVYGVKEIAYAAYGDEFAQDSDCHISFSGE
jgi:iron complex transport system substrate-binding protein